MEIKEFEHLKQSPRWMPERDLLPAIHGKLKQNPKLATFAAVLVAASLALLVLNVWAVASHSLKKTSTAANAPESITELNNSYNIYQ